MKVKTNIEIGNTNLENDRNINQKNTERSEEKAITEKNFFYFKTSNKTKRNENFYFYIKLNLK